jgi:nucleotide-binding universal stress UspA family protein
MQARIASAGRQHSCRCSLRVRTALANGAAPRPDGLAQPITCSREPIPRSCGTRQADRKGGMRMRSSIVCGIDGSKESVSAAKVAAPLAGTLERKLVLAHAMQDPPTFPYDDTWQREVQRRRASEEGKWLLERVAAELPGEEPELRVLFGDPIESLGFVCRDDEVELLVLGSRGRSRLARALLRSVSAHLGSAARCPVIVVPPGAGEHFLQLDRSGGSIVCGIDGSAEAARALRVAAWLAEAMDLQLPPVIVDAGRPSEDPDGDEPTPRVVRSRDPAQALRAYALSSDARLIAVGSRGRNAMRAVLLGSVSGELAATAPLPVLVVSPTAAIARFTTAASGHDRAAAA